MKLSFEGKTAIVTGASKGIGRAVAQLILELGGKVIITGRQEKPQWGGKYGNLQHRCVDFLEEGSLNAFLSGIDQMQRVDVLVNNAGAHIPETIDELDEKNWQSVLQVNLHAPMKIMRCVTPKMKAAKSGRIVNVSSIAAFISRATSAAYSASKTGLLGLTRASALALAADNVLINALCPGYTNTEMMQTVLNPQQRRELLESVPLRRFAEPEEIARFAVWLSSELNTYVTGQTIVVDGGVIIQ